jgi:hypothetical protein
MEAIRLDANESFRVSTIPNVFPHQGITGFVYKALSSIQRK